MFVTWSPAAIIALGKQDDPPRDIVQKEFEARPRIDLKEIGTNCYTSLAGGSNFRLTWVYINGGIYVTDVICIRVTKIDLNELISNIEDIPELA